ncbi:hypothetical protein [Thauera sp.]|uniref:hypothetical protein n=1 Tax=Thauera sp. TaxID=1905334 RepID=UPI002B78FD99|nr:hypothetical protein [Thauera sp.]HRP26381.1 hypothetical protein [Thauera sp.]
MTRRTPAARHAERLRIARILATPMGCICPPTAEQTCMSPLCPRRPINSTFAAGVVRATEGEKP